jgi:hypothetical protein
MVFDRFRLLDVRPDHVQILGLKQQAVLIFDRHASDVTLTKRQTTAAAAPCRARERGAPAASAGRAVDCCGLMWIAVKNADRPDRRTF